MPKQSQRADVNTFIGGLITEASPLNFPANASADEVNFELDRDGSRRRRLGMDIEEGGTFDNSGATLGEIGTAGVTTFRWESVAGDPQKNFLTVQVNKNLFFYDLSVESPSSVPPVGTIEIDQFQAGVKYSFAAIEGYLCIVSGAETIAIIAYDLDAGTFSKEYKRLLVRDVWGVEETLNPSYETDPTFRGLINAQHYYNLQNQSWGTPRKDQTGSFVDPIFYYQLNLASLAPSNSEQVWTAVQQQPVSQGQQPFERLFATMWDDARGASLSSAKGYFIIDALRRGTSRQSAFLANQTKYPVLGGGALTVPDQTPSGPSCIEEFAGRVFYSGFSGQVIDGDARSPNLSNYVFFSQLIKSKKEFNLCYQEGDPTSRENNDLVDTDGGFIRVAGARNIIALRNIQTHLVVIAENGVWAITGGSVDSGFTATNYKTSKISTFGGISSTSVIAEGDRAYYWSDDGIYTVGKNQYGDLVVDTLTLTTIQTLYQSIPNLSKANATGEYDQITKKIRWIYKTGDLFTDTSRTFELIFDSALKNFTQNEVFKLASNIVEVMGVFRSSPFSLATINDNVFVITDPVLSNLDQVVVGVDTTISTIQSLRYLTMVLVDSIPSISFSLYKELTFADWLSLDGIGVDAKAHCLTGTVTAGDSGVDKQIPYLIMHFRRTESGVDSELNPLHQSGCLMRSQWNFANSIVSNKWSPLVEAYRYRKVRFGESPADTFDTGFEVITTKNKLRGRGKAFALYFETEPAKDCQILGWNITLNANQIT